MQDYLASKTDNFDGIAIKRFLLGQAREQVTWYRQSIDALDFVGTVACRRSLCRRVMRSYTRLRHAATTKSPGVSQTTDTPTPSASRGSVDWVKYKFGKQKTILVVTTPYALIVKKCKLTTEQTVDGLLKPWCRKWKN